MLGGRTIRRLAAIGIVATAGAASAQTMPFPPIRPGEILQNGSDHQVKVLQCRPTSYGRECETVAWENGRAASNPSWWDELMLLKGDARVRTALNLPPRAGGGQAPLARRIAPAAAPARAPTPPRAAPARTAGGATTGLRIPDGQYRCQIWMGNNYVDLVSSISGGSLKNNPLAKVGATVTAVTPSPGGFTISYTTARGYRESMDCKR